MRQLKSLKQPSVDMQLQQFHTSITHCHCLNLVTALANIFLLSDLFRVRSRGVRTKIVWTKVSFGNFRIWSFFDWREWRSEIGRSEIQQCT
jgi:hypothetical protein